ncbi:hypothetical protein NKJ87_19865 [Mesorhizobium sp. M0027]|uniref:hypothetical protein n=1 Tax=Mesorhizobium sp. M0027 TaxID=2956848 RepID=UPI00333873F5
MDYQVGTLVACIDGSFRFTRECEAGVVIPRKGAVYRIRTVDFFRHAGGIMPFLRFDEIHNPEYPSILGPYEPVFDSRAFLPLDERRLDVFRQVRVPPVKRPQGVPA